MLGLHGGHYIHLFLVPRSPVDRVVKRFDNTIKFKTFVEPDLGSEAQLVRVKVGTLLDPTLKLILGVGLLRPSFLLGIRSLSVIFSKHLLYVVNEASFSESDVLIPFTPTAFQSKYFIVHTSYKLIRHSVMGRGFCFNFFC